ncbi:MAG: class IV adenylate cyclase [Nanoarchaeota archaeon]
MGHINVEIKAKSSHLDEIRNVLKSLHADFRGVDQQIDTYFKVPSGRLKLREGNILEALNYQTFKASPNSKSVYYIENYLIQYDREDRDGPKQSNVVLYESTPKSTLKEALTKALGILVVVDKQREIYFIDNVKFHLDRVRDLGTFVEIEAIDKNPSIGRDKLLEQCELYKSLFKISPEDLISVSYSDLLLGR